MKALLIALALPVFALSALTAHAAPPSSLPREAGSIYLEDFDLKPVKINTTADANVFNQTVDGRYLGFISRGRPVELLAVSENRVRVRGQAQQGVIVGWVDIGLITPLKPDFLESLRQNAKRKTEVDALVAKGEVALNMTPDEVTAALGRAQKKTSKLDGEGRKETWEFVRYARVPQDTTSYDRGGRLVTSTVYVKVPAGKLVITFEKNLVTGLEQTEGNTDTQTSPRILAAPIYVAW